MDRASTQSFFIFPIKRSRLVFIQQKASFPHTSVLLSFYTKDRGSLQPLRYRKPQRERCKNCNNKVINVIPGISFDIFNALAL